MSAIFLGMVIHFLHLSIGKAKEGGSKFKASLNYLVDSRPDTHVHGYRVALEKGKNLNLSQPVDFPYPE